MRSLFSRDRRGNERRKGERRQDTAGQGGDRQSQRRQRQRRRVERRRSFRIVYPLTLAPETLNSDFRVMNLSQEGVVLRWEGKKDECLVNVTLGSMIRLQIQFHDGEVLDLRVKINRCQSERRSRMRVFAGTECGQDQQRGTLSVEECARLPPGGVALDRGGSGGVISSCCLGGITWHRAGFTDRTHDLPDSSPAPRTLLSKTADPTRERLQQTTSLGLMKLQPPPLGTTG